MRGACPLVLLSFLAACAGCDGHGPGTEPEPTPQEPAAATRPAPEDGAYPGFRVPAFAADVLRPGARGVRKEPFDSRATKGPTLYIVNSSSCPSCLEYVERMRGVEDRFMPRGVDVVHLYPNRTETPEEKTAWHAEKGFRGGQILDQEAAIARKLEVERTPTAYLVDAAGAIVYRGGIDSSAYGADTATPWLANALDALLAGRPVDPATTEPDG